MKKFTFSLVFCLFYLVSAMAQEASVEKTQAAAGQNTVPVVLSENVKKIVDTPFKKMADLEKEINKLPQDKLTDADVEALNEKMGSFMDKEEAANVRSLNRFRRACRLFPCLVDLALCRAARGHSADMQQYGFFSHSSVVYGKENHMVRAQLEGTSAMAENIYMGSESGEGASYAWQSSSGHCANMLGFYRRVGIGRASGYHTQMFGN